MVDFLLSRAQRSWSCASCRRKHNADELGTLILGPTREATVCITQPCIEQGVDRVMVEEATAD